MTEPRKHAILSPSGAEGWMTCARKPLMEKGLPDDDNEYTDEGTCAHEIAARCLTENQPATEYVGVAVEVGEARTYEFRADMAEPVQTYVDLVRDYHRSLPGSELFVEVAVPIGHITGEEGATGTSDAVILGTDEVIVVDLKFGMGVEVSAERNKQAMLYALGAIEKLDISGELQRARMVIVQPRVSSKPSEWDCTIAELEEFREVASGKAAVALAFYNNPPGDPLAGLQPSEKGCKFCRAKVGKDGKACPGLAWFVDATLGADYTTGPDIPSLVPVDLKELGARFRALPLLESYVKAVRARAESTLFELGNSAEAIAALGIKIVEGKQGNREWGDEKAVEEQLKHWRLKQELIYDMSLRSPTQIEKMLKEHGKKSWPSKIGEFVVRKPGKPSVAPADDKRPPLDITPSADGFTAV